MMLMFSFAWSQCFWLFQNTFCSSVAQNHALNCKCNFELHFCPMRAPGSTAPLIYLLILVLCIVFACLHCMLSNLSFFLHFFPYLSLPLRIDLHSFQPRGRKRQQNLRVLVVLVYFILLYFCVSDAWLFVFCLSRFIVYFGAYFFWFDFVYSNAFSALTLLVGQQEGHPASKNWVVRYCCLSVARY